MQILCLGAEVAYAEAPKRPTAGRFSPDEATHEFVPADSKTTTDLPAISYDEIKARIDIAATEYLTLLRLFVADGGETTTGYEARDFEMNGNR